MMLQDGQVCTVRPCLHKGLALQPMMALTLHFPRPVLPGITVPTRSCSIQMRQQVLGNGFKTSTSRDSKGQQEKLQLKNWERRTHPEVFDHFLPISKSTWTFMYLYDVMVCSHQHTCWNPVAKAVLLGGKPCGGIHAFKVRLILGRQVVGSKFALLGTFKCILSWRH